MTPEVNVDVIVLGTGAARLPAAVRAAQSLGRKAPNGDGPEELARRTIRDERGSGQTLVGVLHKDRLDPGVEPRA